MWVVVPTYFPDAAHNTTIYFPAIRALHGHHVRHPTMGHNGRSNGYREVKERNGHLGATNLEAEPNGGVWARTGLQLAPSLYTYPPRPLQIPEASEIPSLIKNLGIVVPYGLLVYRLGSVVESAFQMFKYYIFTVGF